MDGIDQAYEQICAFAQEHGVQRVILFGSRARGDALPRSDVDLAVLARADEQDLANEFVQSGIIDKFSLQFGLGRKLLKDLLRYEGVAGAATGPPRDILKASYRYFALFDEQTWLRMLADRNTIAHVHSAGDAQ